MNGANIETTDNGEAANAGGGFEESLARLESIVDRLESGAVPLEEALLLHEEGLRLKEHCSQLLRKAELRLDRVTTAADGTPALEPQPVPDNGRGTS